MITDEEKPSVWFAKLLSLLQHFWRYRRHLNQSVFAGYITVSLLTTAYRNQIWIQPMLLDSSGSNTFLFFYLSHISFLPKENVIKIPICRNGFEIYLKVSSLCFLYSEAQLVIHFLTYDIDYAGVCNKLTWIKTPVSTSRNHFVLTFWELANL